MSRTPTQNSFPELPLGNLVSEEHADDGDQDVVRDRADDDGTQSGANSDPVDRFVGARPRPESPGGVVVADDDGDVGNEGRQKNWQRDRRDHHNQSDGATGKMEALVAFELASGGLRGIGSLMALECGFECKLLALGSVLHGLGQMVSRPPPTRLPIALMSSKVPMIIQAVEVRDKRRCPALPISRLGAGSCRGS